MHHACAHAQHMVMLQIRNVPDDVHRQLKARAALAGQSLSEFALAELRKTLEKPTRAEVLARIASRPPMDIPSEDVATIIREEREARDRAIDDALGR